MQREFWNDIGRTSDAGETSGSSLLGTPTATMAHRSKRGIRKAGNPAEIARGTRSISSVAASPASLYQWQEINEGTAMSVGCGISFAKLWRSCDRGWSWLKTCQDYCQQTLEGFLELYSETWPRWGSMRNGVAYRHRPLMHRTKDSECSLLPTAATDGTKGGPNQRGSSGRPALTAAVQLLPTPYGLSANQGQGDGEFGKAIRMLPTPQSSDWKGANHSGSGSNSSNGLATAADKLTEAGGLLNPQFVEAIMGFPIGWTALDASETPSCPKSPNGSDDE